MREGNASDDCWRGGGLAVCSVWSVNQIATLGGSTQKQSNDTILRETAPAQGRHPAPHAPARHALGMMDTHRIHSVFAAQLVEERYVRHVSGIAEAVGAYSRLEAGGGDDEVVGVGAPLGRGEGSGMLRKVFVCLRRRRGGEGGWAGEVESTSLRICFWVRAWIGSL